LGLLSATSVAWYRVPENRRDAQDETDAHRARGMR
jgi:hypothetical protein